MDLHTIDLNATITIVLEDTGAKFTVHKEPICAASLFVQGCLQKGFKEGEEQKIAIREWRDSESMHTLITWVYQGKQVLDTSKSSPDEAKEAASKIVKLYVLADKFIMPDLKNDILDQYYDFIICPDAGLEVHYDTINFLTDNG